MADTKISALTGATTPLAGTEVVPLVQSGTTKNVSVDNLTAGRSVATGPLTATHTSGPGITVTRGTKSLDFSGNYAGGDVFASITATTGMDIALLSGGSEILRAVNSGNVNINNGNLVIGTSGKGIDFSANTGAAGMTSETLTWYEEGTWTPNLNGNETLSIAKGYYTRVGRQVTVWFDIAVTTLGTGVDNRIYGLPFTNNSNVICSGSIPYWASTSSSFTFLSCYLNSGSNVIGFTGSDTASTSVTNLPTVFANGTQIFGMVTYFV